MKKILITLSLLLAALMCLQAQPKKKTTATEPKKEEDKPVYVFTDLKVVPHTSVKDQNRSGTCWSFSGMSFIEAEILRLKGDTMDLSDMYPVYRCYQMKADRYFRLHGKVDLCTGGASNDVIDVIRSFGMVPEDAFPGLEYGADKHDHSELDAVLTAFMEAVVKGKKPTPAWKTAYNSILQTYLGRELVSGFNYKGAYYDPMAFANEYIMNEIPNYVKFTSYTHHDFWTSYEMDVPDNWNHGVVYNVPLDNFQAIVENALENGYTVVWGGDVSDQGFNWKKGLAIMPDMENKDLAGTDRDKWETLSQSEKRKTAYSFEKIVPEKEITQEIRQEAYDNYSATDDHGMHIVGIAQDQNGNKYFKIKNSWNVDNPYKGYLYMSIPYFRCNTLDIMIHKNAAPYFVLDRFEDLR